MPTFLAQFDSVSVEHFWWDVSAVIDARLALIDGHVAVQQTLVGHTKC